MVAIQKTLGSITSTGGGGGAELDTECTIHNEWLREVRFYLLVCFETDSYYVATAGLEFMSQSLRREQLSSVKLGSS